MVRYSSSAIHISVLKTSAEFKCFSSNFQNSKKKMADNSQKMAYNAGVAKGQTQEKASGMIDKAGKAAQSAKGTVLGAGQTVQAQAQGAVDAVKNATGMKK